MKLTRDQIIDVLDKVSERTAEDKVTRDDDFICQFADNLRDLLVTEWTENTWVEI